MVTGGRDPSALHDYAYYDLRPRISRIPDVSYVTVQGGDIREIVVEVEPERLVAAGLSLADVADRLGKEHRLKAVGRIDRETAAVPGAHQHAGRRSPGSGEPRRRPEERPGDPRARPGPGDRRARRPHHGRSAPTQQRRRGADGLSPPGRQRPDGLRASSTQCWPTPRTSAPPGIQIVPVYDQGLLVRTAIANVRDAILIGGLFSVLILLLFLKSVRATLLAALSIPLSLMISFVFLRLTGDTLNLMSLGGLAVAIGLIIDDSVVVVENIARHLAEGQTGDAAIAAASREISGAVIGSTLTTILVFVPLAFVRGVVGQFFQSLSLALSVALLVSMVVSLTLVPVLAARFLARRRDARTAGRSTTCWPTATRVCCGSACGRRGRSIAAGAAGGRARLVALRAR